jgi:enoyl-CoA hydratase/carnithine racemase
MDLILTGRPITGKEAFEMGLSNRITSCGTALGKAIQLAGSIAKFPQDCMNRDRLSAYNAMYNAHSFDAAVSYEMRRGLEVIQTVSCFRKCFVLS